MPRRLRIAPGGLVYHVLNRGNARNEIFHDSADYAAFERIIAEALCRVPLELFAYVIMPNHWHLLLRPREDGELSEFMRWLSVAHTQRWHAHRHTGGSGHVYQGRFRSFPVESGRHFLTVCRYIERNAVRQPGPAGAELALVQSVAARARPDIGIAERMARAPADATGASWRSNWATPKCGEANPPRSSRRE